ncbi:MAG: hypothetical protein GX111_09805 [Clostridiales bacterium]|jgi:hypothetical protein|nr:hypothetical protein [Clostridiales bacterium]
MKQYIGVISRHDPDGKSTPLEIIWEDGRRFDIDKVLDVRRAASLKAGGAGIRYTCKIRNREIFLFDEEGRWFIERRDR